MNKHLTLVRSFHQQYGITQPDYPETSHLSDSEIVLRQSLLLACASDTCKAIADGDSVKTLAGLVDLAYNALAAIACRGDDVVSVSVSWRQDGSVLSLTRILSDRVNQCTSGETIAYSGLYSLCQQLCKSFLNADFDTAFQTVHQNLMTQDNPQPQELSAAFYE